jgi:hypothetical protein
VSKPTPLMLVYLAFALAGIVVPWYFNIQHFLTSDIPFTPVTFVQSGLVTPMSSSLTVDFFIGSTAMLIWMGVEGRRLGMRRVWLYFVATFMIAFAFACPFFMFMRERKLAATLDPLRAARA